MKIKLAAAFALIGWFAVIAQYFIMVGNRQTSLAETTIHFFSFFTILTNTLVAIYFTCVALYKNKEIKILNKPGTLSAITIYILMVGLVYQFALRQLWHPEGLQRIVDELLHSIIPILVLVFWYLYERVQSINYMQIFNWTLYPLIYLVYVLVRGSFTNLYPYPFVNVVTIGINNVLINAGVLVVIFLLMSLLIVFIGKRIIKR
jgi:hypothetical protein